MDAQIMPNEEEWELDMEQIAILWRICIRKFARISVWWNEATSPIDVLLQLQGVEKYK